MPKMAGSVELFLGQMIALLPRLAAAEATDPVLRMQLEKLFLQDADDAGDLASAERVPRPRSYSLITDGRGGGILTVGGTEIDVEVLPLDVHTPAEATAFRVVAIAGRALTVTGVAVGEITPAASPEAPTAPPVA